MRGIKKAFIAIPGTLILALVVACVLILSDLSERKSSLDAFVRIAMKDAIVNIQTTEELGLNYNASYDAYSSNIKYQEYLDTIAAQLSDSDRDTIETIQSFLDTNMANLDSDKSGEDMFRPIQFGMTYVDADLLEKSFKSTLDDLVGANYRMNGTPNDLKLSCNDALHVYLDDITLVVDGPHVISLSSADETTKRSLTQLYGIDTAQEYIEQYNTSLGDESASLGISTESVPNFYVYYDISVKVPWGSSSALPLLSEAFIEKLFGPGLQYNEPTAGYSSSDTGEFGKEQRYVRFHSEDMVMNYAYRYVLLN